MKRRPGIILLIYVLILCFCGVSAFGGNLRGKPDIQFIQITSSASYPEIGWQYGLRYYVFWRQSDLHYTIIHFQDGGETARSATYQPPWGVDIGAHLLNPLKADQPYGLDFSVRWHSFQFRTYNSESSFVGAEKFRSKIILSAGYTHELSNSGYDRLNCALWFQIPAPKFADGWLRHRFATNVFIQYNHPVNAKLPEYVFPLQFGLEVGYRIFAWRINND